MPSIGKIIADVLCGLPIPERFGWNPNIKSQHRDQPHLVGRANFEALEKQAVESQDDWNSAGVVGYPAYI